MQQTSPMAAILNVHHIWDESKIWTDGSAQRTLSGDTTQQIAEFGLLFQFAAPCLLNQ